MLVVMWIVGSGETVSDSISARCITAHGIPLYQHMVPPCIPWFSPLLAGALPPSTPRTPVPYPCPCWATLIPHTCPHQLQHDLPTHPLHLDLCTSSKHSYYCIRPIFIHIRWKCFAIANCALIHLLHLGCNQHSELELADVWLSATAADH